MKPLRVLMVEDSEDDALLVARELRRGGYGPALERVETEPELRAALARGPWDVVISDHGLPAFSAPAALEVVKEHDPEGDVPFIIVSGTMPDESAVEAVRAGAGDYVSKQKLARLVPAIERELRDVQLRRERREVLQALKHAVRARDEFLSIASHELKTPLTSLRLQVEAVTKRLARGESIPASDERLATRLAAIDRSTARLTDLVNRLLDISRLTAGELELSREPADLARVVGDAIARMQDAITASGSQVSVALSPAVGRWDRTRLESVVANLLDNAVKYGGGRPVTVTVTDAGTDAILEVRDSGIGIAEVDQIRIFDRFARAAPKEAYEGLGIGLWLTRRILQAHGGSIEVRSRPGEGATFTVRLPKDGGAA